MENQGKEKVSLTSKLGSYFKDYFAHLNYPAWIICIVVSIGLFLLDYFTKRAAYYDPILAEGKVRENFIPGLIDLVLVGNRGAAFGSMSGWSWFLIPVSCIASVALATNLLFRFRKYNWGMTIGITLMLPGAVGNLIDRIGLAAQIEPYKYGVIDFLRFHFWQSFPVCNVADYCLSVGIVCLFIGFFFEFRKEYRQMKKEEAEEKMKAASPAAEKENDEMANKLAQLEKKNQASQGEEDGRENVHRD